MSEADAGQLCRQTLMGLMPALAERDFRAFATHIDAIQRTVGEYFAPLQGGVFTSVRVARVIEWLRIEHAVTGVGQSSWGPTAFVFVPNESRGRELQMAIEQAFADEAGLTVGVYKARNHGARIALDSVEHVKKSPILGVAAS